MRMEFAPWPYYDDDEILAVINTLKSGRVNQWTGDQIQTFESEFLQYTGVSHAIALANGSLALDLSLIALEIGEGDEVIVTPRSFIASVSCVALQKATPVFVDVDPVSQNITADKIAEAITKKTKAVIAVNLAGWPCELDRIQALCKSNGIALIEDCAQAHGASYKGKRVGSFGDCAIFSFCQDKIMTTGGEGGMLVTGKSHIWEKVWSYKDHGKSIDSLDAKEQINQFRWLADSFGTNCRMTEMQAAIGSVMLTKLDQWVLKRRRLAQLFTKGFEQISGLRTTEPDSNFYHSYYKYYVFVEGAALRSGWTTSRILDALKDSGIPCKSGICPEIYLEKVFKNYPHRLVNAIKYDGRLRLPVAKQLGETSMMFMVHPTLGESAIEYVIDHVKGVMAKAVR